MQFGYNVLNLNGRNLKLGNSVVKTITPPLTKMVICSLKSQSISASKRLVILLVISEDIQFEKNLFNNGQMSISFSRMRIYLSH